MASPSGTGHDNLREQAETLAGSMSLRPLTPEESERGVNLIFALLKYLPPVAVPGPASVSSPADTPEIAHKEPEPMDSRERTLRFWLARLTAYPRWVSIGSINSHAELSRISAEDYAKIQEVLRGR